MMGPMRSERTIRGFSIIKNIEAKGAPMRIQKPKHNSMGYMQALKPMFELVFITGVSEGSP